LAGHGVEPANRASSREGSPGAGPQPTLRRAAPDHADAAARLADAAAFAGPFFDPPAAGVERAMILPNDIPLDPSAPAAISALARCLAPIRAQPTAGAASAKERLA